MIEEKERKMQDMLEAITDIREFDVPYHSRVCIDLNIRAGLWYKIGFSNSCIDIN
jgi:DNA polymerase epsilon subunit 1